MLQNYLAYLNFLDGKLNKFFEKQKPYIFCKKGCGVCCKNAQFAYSNIEVNYLILGVAKLDSETKKLVSQSVKKVISEREIAKDPNFKYDCPFLIDNVCSVYQYRGVVCRSFGLANMTANGKLQVPFCCFEGLNYSNVIDDSGTRLSEEKFKKLNVKEEPLAFNISYKFLTSDTFEKAFKFKFGERKPLIEWFLDQDAQKNEDQINN